MNTCIKKQMAIIDKTHKEKRKRFQIFKIMKIVEQKNKGKGVEGKLKQSKEKRTPRSKMIFCIENTHAYNGSEDHYKKFLIPMKILTQYLNYMMTTCIKKQMAIIDKTHKEK